MYYDSAVEQIVKFVAVCSENHGDLWKALEDSRRLQKTPAELARSFQMHIRRFQTLLEQKPLEGSQELGEPRSK